MIRMILHYLITKFDSIWFKNGGFMRPLKNQQTFFEPMPIYYNQLPNVEFANR